MSQCFASPTLSFSTASKSESGLEISSRPSSLSGALTESAFKPIQGYGKPEWNEKTATNGKQAIVVSALRSYLEGNQDNSSVSFSQAIFAPVLAGRSEGPPSTMKVKYSRVSEVNEHPEWEYPFERLSVADSAYRGYPIKGPEALKNNDWTVQIVGSALGAPPQPLPQFPQQEVLGVAADGSYVSLPAIPLTDEEVAWNSGRAYLKGTDHTPTSRSFYTSGFHKGSAVEVLKPFHESIYDTVVNGATVEVPSDSRNKAV